MANLSVHKFTYTAIKNAVDITCIIIQMPTPAHIKDKYCLLQSVIQAKHTKIALVRFVTALDIQYESVSRFTRAVNVVPFGVA